MRRLLPIAALISALALAGCDLREEDPVGELGVGGGGDQPGPTFPSVATKNTVRIGGDDSASILAGAASAAFPATSSATRPDAVVLVDERDWQSGIAASVLMSAPIAAPMLATADGDLPEVSRDALNRLNPKGSDLSDDAQVIRIGDRAARPDGRKAAVIGGDNAYERAAAIDRFFTSAKGEPSDDVLIASGDRPAYAMPAAAYAARSGDAVLFTRRDRLPDATKRALERHERPDIFILGPTSVISPAVARELDDLGARITRIDGPTPVENAVEFAKFKQGGFGWGLVQPGQNLTLGNTRRPLDAAASAPFGTRGTFGALLLTDSAERMPRPLENYFLDIQPGFEKDPNRGVFNRVWILGDESAVSLNVQGRVDELAELIPVQIRRP